MDRLNTPPIPIIEVIRVFLTVKLNSVILECGGVSVSQNPFIPY